jgi:hypothetical protein
VDRLNTGTELATEPSGQDQLTPEQLRRRRSRSIAIALAIAALVIVMLAITFVKGPGAIVRPI